MLAGGSAGLRHAASHTSPLPAAASPSWGLKVSRLEALFPFVSGKLASVATSPQRVWFLFPWFLSDTAAGSDLSQFQPLFLIPLRK